MSGWYGGGCGLHALRTEQPSRQTHPGGCPGSYAHKIPGIQASITYDVCYMAAWTLGIEDDKRKRALGGGL